MKRHIITLGDKTTHGGEVIQSSHSLSICGKSVALVGDNVFCPKCNGDFPILSNSSRVSYQGKLVVVEGMKTACGAILIASQNIISIDD